ncbi:hypothetical protein [Yanshouia hominis]|uniref:Uncharacterized protein n=1 Tax=Yanshouia hominis TaxID=2763673 RepID=A0ABR7NMJ6_9FIRM|nr:hypothetical protein [Yanshouia hominis]MBC8577637.1 hypothetical protein [Yanshouia hominis]
MESVESKSEKRKSCIISSSSSAISASSISKQLEIGHGPLSFELSKAAANSPLVLLGLFGFTSTGLLAALTADVFLIPRWFGSARNVLDALQHLFGCKSLRPQPICETVNFPRCHFIHVHLPFLDAVRPLGQHTIDLCNRCESSFLTPEVRTSVHIGAA